MFTVVKDEQDGSPQERAAATKKRRTRERLLAAADKLVRERGIEVRAEDVAVAAGVSVATFYSVFPSKSDMFTVAFRELVLGDMPDHAGYIDHADALIRYLNDLYRAVADRKSLIRGALLARIYTPAPLVQPGEWIASGESGGDIALELAHDILEIVLYHHHAESLSDSAVFAEVYAAQAMALFVLDGLAVGLKLTPEHIAQMIYQLTPKAD